MSNIRSSSTDIHSIDEELYQLLDEGCQATEERRGRPADEVMAGMMQRYAEKYGE